MSLENLYHKVPFYKPLEVTINTSDDYLRVRETLTRIGVGSFANKTLWQTCHIQYDSGKYYIMHFLEVLLMNGEDVSIRPEDIMRRNTVASLIVDWGLCSFVRTPGKLSDQMLRIIPYKEKGQWKLLSKATPK